MMNEEEEKAQKIQMIGFTTNDKNYSPNDIISNYLNNNSHFIIKKSTQLIAFSTVLPDQKKPTKIMLITLLDLEIEYEGINEVNCYLIIIDLQKETSKDKLSEILAYINQFCNLSKKIYLLGVKKDEEENKIKLTEEEILQKIKEMNVEYEYFELNLDNSFEASEKILEILKYCLNYTCVGEGKGDNDQKSCAIY